MSTSETRDKLLERRKALPARWPMLVPLLLLGIALLLRILDIYVLRLDELVGEIVLSKALGFALVIGYTWWVGQGLAAIGLHTRRLGAALMVGAGLTLAAFIISGVVQVLTFAPGQTLTIQAMDPKTGMVGGGAFAVFLIAGNAINAFMEEGLFRGIMLPHFLQRRRFLWANVLQASLFSAWHLVWPLRAYLDGDVSAVGAVAQAGLLVLGTFVAGLVYGYLFWRTDSLWAPWIAHFLNNTALNLLVIRGADGDLQTAMVMSVASVTALAFLAFAVRPIARRLMMPTLEPWSSTQTPEVRQNGAVREASRTQMMP